MRFRTAQVRRVQVATLLRYTAPRHPKRSSVQNFREAFSAMRSPFYQGNFCSECGNPCASRFSFRPRYFCDDCAARLNQRRLATPLAGLLLAASLAVFAFSYKSNRTQEVQNTQDNTAAASSVSAQDSIVNPQINSQSKPSAEGNARVFCGARTRRGTPCRHLVQQGQRCAQHRGMPSILTAPKQQQDR